MNCGLNFNCRAFPTTESEFLCSPLSFSASLCDSCTNTFYLAAQKLCSQLFPVQLLNQPFISVTQQSFVKEPLTLRTQGPQHFIGQLFVLTAFQMDASGLIVYHGTHTQALVSPHSSLGTKFLCVSVVTEISHPNTSCETQRPKQPKLEGLLCLFPTAQVHQILHILTACVLLAKKGNNILLSG